MTRTDEHTPLRIGEVAARAGVSTRALRYYEEEGLLVAARTSSGQRTYGEEAVERVRLIQQLYAAGLPSRSILTLLPCVDSGFATPAMLDVLEGERDRISLGMRELKKARSQLDRIITATRESAAGV